MRQRSDQIFSVLRRIGLLVVIEIEVDVPFFLFPGENVFPPAFQSCRGITAAISRFLRTMEPDIDEVSGHFQGRKEAAQVVNTEGRIELLEDLESFRLQPGGVAKLKGIAIISRHFFEKSAQSFRVEFPFRRKLEEYGQRHIGERLDGAEEFHGTFVRIEQLLIVGNETAGFDGEAKRLRNRFPPGFGGGTLRCPVEGGVNFDRGKMLGVKREPLQRRKIFGEKCAFPMWVSPARGSNINGHLSRFSIFSATLVRRIGRRRVDVKSHCPFLPGILEAMPGACRDDANVSGMKLPFLPCYFRDDVAFIDEQDLITMGVNARLFGALTTR